MTHLSERELATVLAALRYWQQDLASMGSDDQAGPISPHFDEHAPLTAEEIDSLCERLNSLSDTSGREYPDGPCDCERPGMFCCGVPGILACLENGRLAPGAIVERCDQCQRFPSDEVALARLVELGIAPVPTSPFID